jgi:hypothetical protein
MQKSCDQQNGLRSKLRTDAQTFHKGNKEITMKRHIHTTVALFGIMAIALLLSGCASPTLMDQSEVGRYEMRADRDPLDDLFAEHVHFTREAAAGGKGVGGGGCGCN